MKMRKLIFITFFLHLTFVLLSQTRPSIVDTNSVWNVLIVTMVPYPHTHSEWWTESIKFSGDTLIGLNHYKKIWKSYDSLMISWQKNFFIREDSLKRTFINSGDGDHLLYNFNAQLGDTLEVGFAGNQIILTEVDSVFIYNKNYKRFLFSNDEIWIENIGSLSGILYSGFLGSNWTNSTSLLCFVESDTLKYSKNNTCYMIYTGISEMNRNEVKVVVSPNPVSSSSLIRLITNQNKDYTLEIYNCLGMKFKTFEISSDGEIKINKSEFSSGTYYYILLDPESNFSGGKFIIE
jgi:hypothetical protein